MPGLEPPKHERHERLPKTIKATTASPFWGIAFVAFIQDISES